MKNKVLLIMLSVMVLSIPFQEQRVHALTTKVATKVATQAFKEVVKDTAKEMAFKTALDEVGKIYDPNNKYVFKEGYHGYCFQTVKPDGSCDKPVQVKSEVTSADTDKLDDAVGKRMDAKIGGSLYATKWGKWLDWAVPIYAISAAGVALDYAINGEDSVAGMINEIAMESLEDIGVIAPVEKLVPDILDENGNLILDDSEPSIINGNLNTTSETMQKREVIIENTSTTTSMTQPHIAHIPVAESKVIVIDREIRGEENPVLGNTNKMKFGWTTNIGNVQPVEFEIVQDGQMKVRVPTTYGYSIYKNGKKIDEKPSGGGAIQTVLHPDIIQSPVKKSIFEYPMMATPYIEGPNYRETFVHVLENGDVYKIINIKNWNWTTLHSRIHFQETVPPRSQVATRINLYPLGTFISFSAYEPNWIRDLPELVTIPIDHSSFKKNENTLMFPPIDSMKITDSSTGEPAYITTDPTTGEQIITDSEGNPINEDSVGVAPGTGFIKSPDGVTYTPATPTTENPNKDPVTIPNEETPTEPTPDPDSPPPTDPTVPEGSSCAKDWELPSFEPLENTMSEAFPFSIPWDMQNALESAFGGIGTERPSFSLDMNFAGGSEWEITLPAFFDDWKPFTDTLLVFLFDIGIMFGIYRFMKGGNG